MPVVKHLKAADDDPTIPLLPEWPSSWGDLNRVLVLLPDLWLLTQSLAYPSKQNALSKSAGEG